MQAQSLKDLPYIRLEACRVLTKDDNIVDEHFANVANQPRECPSHSPLKECRCILETKRHSDILKEPTRSCESSESTRILVQGNMMKTRTEVKSGEEQIGRAYV